MKNNQTITTDITGLPDELAREIHNLIKDQNKEMQEKMNEEFKRLKHFSEVQNELTEFRLFLSLHADEEELKRISNKTRQNRDKLWQDLLQKNKGNDEKARDFFYE